MPPTHARNTNELGPIPSSTKTKKDQINNSKKDLDIRPYRFGTTKRFKEYNDDYYTLQPESIVLFFEIFINK